MISLSMTSLEESPGLEYTSTDISVSVSTSHVGVILMVFSSGASD